jgi:Uma2 family endonuclease
MIPLVRLKKIAMLLNDNPRRYLPSAKDLPDSDDTPVDNELQDLIPHLLKDILAIIWAERMDWFFGVDMGIYHDPDEPAIVPDGFLSLGVPRIIDEDLRLSYVLWEEKKVPILVLEVVSHKRRKEYTEKKDFYAKLRVLYYVVYNPLRKRKPRLEVYQLEQGSYQLLEGETVFLPELGLGIGREEGIYQGIKREWLYWYDEQGKRFLTPEERIEQGEIAGKLASVPFTLQLGATVEQIAKALDLPLEKVQEIAQQSFKD